MMDNVLFKKFSDVIWGKVTGAWTWHLTSN